MTKLGDFPANLAAIQKVREEIFRKDPNSERREIEDARWGKFSAIAEALMEACKGRNLEMLAKSARDLKNRLSRPGIRRQLAELRGEDFSPGKLEEGQGKKKRIRLRKENRYLKDLKREELNGIEIRKQKRLNAETDSE